MLVPRFTIRTLLAVLTGAAVVFLVAGMAVRGETWAWGVTIGFFFLVVTALAHAAWFGLVWLFAQLPAKRQEGGGDGSPLRAGPQVAGSPLPASLSVETSGRRDGDG